MAKTQWGCPAAAKRRSKRPRLASTTVGSGAGWPRGATPPIANAGDLADPVGFGSAHRAVEAEGAAEGCRIAAPVAGDEGHDRPAADLEDQGLDDGADLNAAGEGGVLRGAGRALELDDGAPGTRRLEGLPDPAHRGVGEQAHAPAPAPGTRS